MHKMVTKTVLAIVSSLATAVLLFAVGDLQDIHDHLKALLQAWESDNPHTTVMGRLRALLAALTWLGPLRPDAPRDPLRECGMGPACDGCWTMRGRLPCLEDRMAEARADHNQFEARLLGLVIMAVSLLASVSFLLAEAPQDGPGLSSSRGFVIGNARLAKQRQSWSCSPGRISRHKRLKGAGKAALSRRRRKQAGEKVSHDSLDWWREADNSRGKLVVQPREHLGEKFLPYRYPELPRPRGRMGPYGAPPIPQQGGRCPCAAASRCRLLLQATILLLLVYLCFG